MTGLDELAVAGGARFGMPKPAGALRRRHPRYSGRHADHDVDGGYLRIHLRDRLPVMLRQERRADPTNKSILDEGKY
jgi:hypothetical protein